MSGEEIAAALLPKMEAEAERRASIYAAEIAAAPQLADALPLFKLTHTARNRRCNSCARRIPGGELHFVADGLRVCQDVRCASPEPAIQPALRLVAVDGQLV